GDGPHTFERKDDDMSKIPRPSMPLVSLLFGLSLGVLGCATTGEYPDPAPAIKKLSDAHAQARREQVAVLSPTLFDESTRQLEEAKKKHARGRDPRDELRDAEASLARAVQTAKPARAALEDVLEARRKAIAADAP